MKNLILNGAGWGVHNSERIIMPGKFKIILGSNFEMLDLWLNHENASLCTECASIKWPDYTHLKEFPLPGVSGADRIRKKEKRKK